MIKNSLTHLLISQAIQVILIQTVQKTQAKPPRQKNLLLRFTNITGLRIGQVMKTIIGTNAVRRAVQLPITARRTAMEHIRMAVG